MLSFMIPVVYPGYSKIAEFIYMKRIMELFTYTHDPFHINSPKQINAMYKQIHLRLKPLWNQLAVE